MARRAELRLFVALWPSRNEARAMREYAATLSCGTARPVAEGNIHLTLAFLGSVEADRMSGLAEMIDRIEVPPFELSFDQVGHWPRPGVVWVGCGATPQPLASLVGALRDGARALAIDVERRRFVAHVTLFRKAAALEAAPAPRLQWQCREVVLAASSLQPGGAQYDVLQRFPLAGVDPHPL